MNRPKIRPILGSILLICIIAILIPNHLFGPQITIFGPIEFIRLKGEPATKTVTFDSPIYVKQGTLTIFNGDGGGKHLVTSGNVIFNGQTIMAPKDFKKKNPEIKQTVEIIEHNTLTVILRSKPSARLAMWITAIVPEPQLEVSITPTEINAGESAILSWSSNYADGVLINNGIGKVEMSGSIAVNPGTTTTYKVTAQSSATQRLPPSPSTTRRKGQPSIHSPSPSKPNWKTLNQV